MALNPFYEGRERERKEGKRRGEEREEREGGEGGGEEIRRERGREERKGRE